MEQPCVHHDALEFPDGKIVLVTRLREGQHATVLQMPAATSGEGDAAAASGGDERMLETAAYCRARLAGRRADQSGGPINQVVLKPWTLRGPWRQTGASRLRQLLLPDLCARTYAQRGAARR